MCLNPAFLVFLQQVFRIACVPDLRHVAQLLQGCGGRGRGRVALLHQVGEVAVVAVIPEPVALAVTASPPLLCLRVGKTKGLLGVYRKSRIMW